MDNPSAFPFVMPDGGGENGMDLLDWFAGQALVGMFANTAMLKQADGNKDLANVAYAAANAMLAERTAQQEARLAAMGGRNDG